MHILPGPTPTFIPSTPQSHKNLVPSDVHTLPAIISNDTFNSALTSFIFSIASLTRE